MEIGHQIVHHIKLPRSAKHLYRNVHSNYLELRTIMNQKCYQCIDYKSGNCAFYNCAAVRIEGCPGYSLIEPENECDHFWDSGEEISGELPIRYCYKCDRVEIKKNGTWAYFRTRKN